MRCTTVPPVREPNGGLPVPPLEPGLRPAEPLDSYAAGAPALPGWTAARSQPPGPLESRALEDEARQQDELRAREIYRRMAADRALWEARMQALLRDLQTELFELWQEVMVRRRKAHDKVLEAWHKVLTE